MLGRRIGSFAISLNKGERQMSAITKPWIVQEKPAALSGTSLLWDEHHIVLSSPEPLLTANTSLFAGGLLSCRHLLNRHVDSSYHPKDPEVEMGEYIRSIRLAPESTAGMMTAVDLRDAVGIAAEHRDFRMFVLATVGVRNASRGGVRYDTLFPAYHPGTINLMLLMDTSVTPGALLNAIVTATEAKAAALQDEKVEDSDGRPATGTTTDAVLAAATQSAAYGVTHRYMGVSTEIGSALGQAVYEAVRYGTRLYRARSSDRQRR